MAQKDYTGALQLSNRLIERFGRSVLLLAADGTPPDPTKPWEAGPDARGELAELDTVLAVGLGTGGLGRTLVAEDLLKTVEQVYLVAPGLSAARAYEITTHVRDGGTDYTVKFVQTLQPANETLLYVIGVVR